MQPIASIQYLRALAALMVVVGHAQHDASVWSAKFGMAFAKSHLLPWGAGVDLFFVISGFIMVYASRDLFGQPGAPGLFLKRRLIRIVPLYWMLASLYIVAMALQNISIGKPWPAPLAMAASYLFLPVDTYLAGVTQPFFTLGWTLNYEMFFYLCFAAMILLPRTMSVLTLAMTFLAIVALGALAQPAAVPLAFWSQPIILEFVLGMLIALAMLSGLRLSQIARVALVLGGGVLLMWDFLASSAQAEGWVTPNDFARLLAWGTPAAMIVAGVALGPRRRQANHAASRLALLLGDASYALYLSHPFVIVMARKGLLATGLFQTAGGWMLVAVALLASSAVAILIHRRIEKPLTRALTRRFASAPPAPAGLSAKPA